MNATGPSSKETPGLNLPPPVEKAADQLPAPIAGAQPEVAGPAAAPERAPSSAAAGAAAAQPPIPLPATPAPATQAVPASAPSATQSSGGLIKDDDLIEKEWVDRAKRIVAQTRNDPHQQSEQLTGVKVEYMKQHYGKTIKVSK